MILTLTALAGAAFTAITATSTPILITSTVATAGLGAVGLGTAALSTATSASSHAALGGALKAAAYVAAKEGNKKMALRALRIAGNTISTIKDVKKNSEIIGESSQCYGQEQEIDMSKLTIEDYLVIAMDIVEDAHIHPESFTSRERSLINRLEQLLAELQQEGEQI